MRVSIQQPGRDADGRPRAAGAFSRGAVTWTILLLAVTLVGCGSARRGIPLTGEHELDDPVLQMGRRAFDVHCNTCHPGGAGGLGPAINNKPLPGFLIRFQVRNGLGAMPSFSDEDLTDEQLDAVVAYLKHLRGLDRRRDE